MPNQLKAGSHRVSYVEEVSTSKALGILAAAKGCTISALIREANLDYLKKEDPTGEILKIAKTVGKTLSDSATERVGESFDKETTQALAKILKKFKK
jgi:hypothetical protein